MSPSTLWTFFAVTFALAFVAGTACTWLVTRLGALANSEMAAKATASKEGEYSHTATRTSVTDPLSVASCSTSQVRNLAMCACFAEMQMHVFRTVGTPCMHACQWAARLALALKTGMSRGACMAPANACVKLWQSDCERDGAGTCA